VQPRVARIGHDHEKQFIITSPPSRRTLRVNGRCAVKNPETRPLLTATLAESIPASPTKLRTCAAQALRFKYGLLRRKSTVRTRTSQTLYLWKSEQSAVAADENLPSRKTCGRRRLLDVRVVGGGRPLERELRKDCCLLRRRRQTARDAFKSVKTRAKAAPGLLDAAQIRYVSTGETHD